MGKRKNFKNGTVRYDNEYAFFLMRYEICLLPQIFKCMCQKAIVEIFFNVIMITFIKNDFFCYRLFVTM